MEKLIVLAGWQNSGKTTTLNNVIKKLLSDKYAGKQYEVLCGDNVFWNTTDSGAMIIDDEIGIVTYGDKKSETDKIFKILKEKGCRILICCCHVANKCNGTFKSVHEFIGDLDLTQTMVYPFFKNCLSYHGKEIEDLENEMMADIIVSLV
ncbi:MAG TPA: ATP-binding protein [Candidatus Stercoripulliclostridium merdipullorum]|uniref:ATP-binding protein n=1 Tax=Candidatus Stercoripulliclostridium merdipullorum TaxID=2840952 RepID=A0A9D1SX84_9FIRM|nr:ATP-binding protein [Candidatus Stercoripulliclostridium merdipullorum]